MKTQVLAGDRLETCQSALSGCNTHVRDDCIYASVSGYVENSQTTSNLPTVSVRRLQHSEAMAASIGDVVLGKVTKINTRFATMEMLVVNGRPCRRAQLGLIRTQDVRLTNKDSVEISKCFRPGDVVLAVVVSLGDARSYFLSTARDDLGVVVAKSISGEALVPISWQEMICSKTMMKEYRKCAKPC